MLSRCGLPGALEALREVAALRDEVARRQEGVLHGDPCSEYQRVRRVPEQSADLEGFA